MNRILFLCTGNYYRSRFAELLFNALATEQNFPWHALSRGLALDTETKNVGPMSQHAVRALTARGITSAEVQRYPLQVQDDDLRHADRIIALYAEEHRAYVQERYPQWMDHVAYWQVRDVLPGPTYDPLREIEREVQGLLPRLAP